MEKNTTGTTVMVLAESAAAEAVITVDLDPEALSCPRCIRPLKHPVFQCAAGHLVCSSCHGNLPDKKACASCFVKTGYIRCFIPTGYSRCHGVERILRSLSVACPNASYGCTSGKMLYHEKTEHEKTCSSTAGSCGIRGRVVKMGPCGGGGGNASEMDVVNGLSRIVKVVVWHDMMVDGMLVFYELDGAEVRTKQWGLPWIAKRSEISLEQDEYLIDMKGNLGDCKGWFRLRSLTLVSNRRTFGPYGTEEGAPFDLPAAGSRIIGFHGRSGTFLDALGTYVKMDA